MHVPYWLDLTQQVTKAVTATDSMVEIPFVNATNPLGTTADIGSEWYLGVDSSPVSVNIGAAAVFGVNAIIETGSYLTVPLYLPPGETLHVICGSGQTATVSLIRARRTA